MLDVVVFVFVVFFVLDDELVVVTLFNAAPLVSKNANGSTVIFSSSLKHTHSSLIL